MNEQRFTEHKNAHNQSCCGHPLTVLEDHFGGGSHYWTLRCGHCLKRYIYDTYDFKLHENFVTAQHLVNRLLEGSPYDVDDPLEKNEIPAGFIARLETERMEVRYDGQSRAKGYRFSKFWIDPWTGKERVLRDGIFQPVSANNAAVYLASEMKRWRDGGWEIEEL